MTNSVTDDYPPTTELTSREEAKQLSPWYHFKLHPSKQPLLIMSFLWAAICLVIYDAAVKVLGMSFDNLALLCALLWLFGLIPLFIAYLLSDQLTQLIVNKEGKVVVDNAKGVGSVQTGSGIQEFTLSAESKLTWFGIYLALSPTRPMDDEKQYYFIARDGLVEADYRRLAAIVIKANRG